VVAKLEWNALVNPSHPDSAKLVISGQEKVLWDKRLFEHYYGREVAEKTPITLEYQG
jgi:hypothetical protein